MAENKIKPPVEEEVPAVEEAAAPEPEPRRRRSSGGARKIIRAMHLFGVFNRNQIVHAMPFILFITMLIIGYIGNSYYAERVIREIDKTKNELKEKRAEYISTKSELMFRSKQSEVAARLEPSGIRESTEPPQMLIIPAKKVK